MKKIIDERLIIQNLKNVRIAFLIQTVGIIIILLYDLITKGLDAVKGNPLWFLLLITTTIYLYLTLSISIDHEKSPKSIKRNFQISLVILSIVSIIVGVLVTFSEEAGLLEGAVIGIILFICGLIPAIYIYHLRKKQGEDADNF